MILPSRTYEISALWWFWLPIAVFAAVAAANPFLDDTWHPLMYAENGILETAQFLIAAAAAVVGIFCLRHCDTAWLRGWVMAGILGSAYIALEEISYGQHIFDWHTPAYWEALNDQNETNLHNTSSWFDQKPRLLLMLGVIAGGCILPFIRRARPALLPKKFGIVYPSDMMFWTSLLTLASHFAKQFDKRLDGHRLFDRASEVNEFYIYYFLLLYMVVLYIRLTRKEG